MSPVTFLGNVFQGKYNIFFTSLYKRNKILLIVSAAIFFSSILIGYFLSGAIDPLMTKAISSLKGKFSKRGINTLSIFLNNITSAFFIYATGIIFGIFTVGILFFNGLLIGYVASKVPIGIFLLYIIPHGIFEIPALIISGAAGFRLTNMVINMIGSLIRSKPISEHYWEFKDSLALFAIAIILLFIAANIEANITAPLANYIKSLFGM